MLLVTWQIKEPRVQYCGIPSFAEALGMESDVIPNSSITASSRWSHNLKPERGRLNANWGWAPKNGNNEWIQVKLENPTCIVGLATQGVILANPEWVTGYKVGCGLQVQSIVMVTENSSDGISEKIFSANTDEDTVVYNGLPEPHLCRFVRVYPVSWSVHPSMRMELYTARV
ncbi:neuropilin-1-like [Diadema antillarum]|uniref:neuropilin-1-like n=1 Tax=Diadema antillarum TaxID=105358 RepID=UPI003A8C17D7